MQTRTGPGWSLREDENLRACVAGGMLAATIAERLDRTKPEVEERIADLGLRRPRIDNCKRRRA